jgi:hypothetical protein
VLEDVDVSLATLGTCRYVWGDDLLAFLLGAGADGPVAGWRLGRALRDDPSARSRLRLLDHLAQQFPDWRAARAWARSRHAELGFRSPAEVVRAGSPDEAAQVLELAERESEKV